MRRRQYDQRLWVTVKEASLATRIPQRTIRHAIQRGKLRAVHHSPRRTVVYLPDVAAWKLALDTACR